VSRYAPSGASYSFGPGPWTPAVRAIILANIGVFLITSFSPGLVQPFGLSPEDVLTRGRIWQPVTYLFLHAGVSHILFNMLIVWMFGVDLERRWGARAFTTYYFVTGVGAGLSMMLVSLLPFDATRAVYYASTVGASGACYGLLMAWALLFPTRQILFALIFPMQARYFVLILGAIAFFSALSSGGGPVAHLAHLGGLLVGYLYLKGPRGLSGELRYRLTRWKMERLRRRFDVHEGGKRNWQDRVH
jgi:membrane associated rhomboid family serine protease